MEQPTLSFKQFDHDQNTSILCIIVVDAAGTLRLYGPLAKIAQDVWLLPTMAAISKSVYGCLAINKDKDKKYGKLMSCHSFVSLIAVNKLFFNSEII